MGFEGGYCGANKAQSAVSGIMPNGARDAIQGRVYGFAGIYHRCALRDVSMEMESGGGRGCDTGIIRNALPVSTSFSKPSLSSALALVGAELINSAVHASYSMFCVAVLRDIDRDSDARHDGDSDS